MAKRILGRVLPGVLFTVGFGFAACTGDGGDATEDCVPGTTTTTSGGGGGADAGSNDLPPGGDGEPETGMDGNNFHHPMDPTQPGQADPFEILKKRAAEGPPNIRTRLHSCSKLSYASIGEFLVSRGVNMNKMPDAEIAQPAGMIYKSQAAKDALGVANFDARMGESYFYTISAATKLFDIFVQAAPEIIAKIETAPACQINGKGYALFDDMTGSCVYYGLSCLMGRPATDDDMALCNLMVSQDTGQTTQRKREITVAAFLAAAHTCE
jgi:hypothetical protein